MFDRHFEQFIDYGDTPFNAYRLQYIFADTDDGAITINLDNSQDCRQRTHFIYNTGTSGNDVTVQSRRSGDTINGTTTYTISDSELTFFYASNSEWIAKLIYSGQDTSSSDPVVFRTSTWPPLRVTRLSTSTSSVSHALEVVHETSADMIDGFGGGIVFSIMDSADVMNNIGYIQCKRDGADNSGKWRFWLNNAGTPQIAFEMTKEGNFIIGTGTAGVDYTLTFNGESNDGVITYDEDNNLFTVNNFLRSSSSVYRRYYHIPLGTANPGASGAAWVAADANTTGGWRLTNAAHLLRGGTDIHADWDGATDLTFEVRWCVNTDNTGGAAEDTVDLKAVVRYKGTGDTAVKTQTVEVPTTIGASAQYKQFKTTFTIDWNYTDNVVEVGDVMSIVFNLETDTSEVDDIIVTDMSFYYSTTHLGIESGDT